MLILVEFQIFTKMCSLSPRLGIPMLQKIIQHLKVSLIVYFLRGLVSPLASHADCHLKSAFIMARDPDKYIELQNFSFPANLICSVLSERLGNRWGKTSDV